jgi:FtsZ-interacting cell division protein ZipA
MAELRWILLLAGLLFLAALAAWELRRPRQARRDSLGPSEHSSRRSERSEPQMGEMAAIDSQAMAPVEHNERIPVMTPLHVDMPPLEPQELAFEPQFETLPQLPPQARAEPPPLAPVQPAALEMPVGELPAPIVDWPPESERQIISVRLVGVNPDRMSGRPLRQALSACGFVHGRFGIFHQPGADGRALISAANLSKPGVFDPGNMDFQRFRGLGLFAVLPGPLPPTAALDHLLDTAGDLAQRLQARLQDEHGLPLDQIRLEALARSVHDMNGGAMHAEPAA